MTAERVHHPSCSARWGGLCTSCPSVTKAETAHEPDIRCAICNETYIIAGESISARRAALAAWPGCCTQTPAGDVGEAPSPAGSDADPSALDPRTGRQAAGDVEAAPPSPVATHPDDLPATYKRRRKVRPGKSRPSLLSGVPAWAARRWAVGR